jgi:hypothetical protein
MIESAAIYPIVLFIAGICWTIQSGGFYIFFNLYPTTIGIVTTLLTVRLHLATIPREGRTTLFTLPAFIDDSGSPDTSGEGPENQRQLTNVEVKSLPALASETQ